MIKKTDRRFAELPVYAKFQVNENFYCYTSDEQILREYDVQELKRLSKEGNNMIRARPAEIEYYTTTVPIDTSTEGLCYFFAWPFKHVRDSDCRMHLSLFKYLIEYVFEKINKVYLPEVIFSWISIITFFLIAVWELQDPITLAIYSLSTFYILFVDTSRFLFSKYLPSFRFLNNYIGKYLAGGSVVMYSLIYGYEFQSIKFWTAYTIYAICCYVLSTFLTLKINNGLRDMVNLVDRAIGSIGGFLFFTLLCICMLATIRVLVKKNPYEQNPDEIFEGTLLEFLKAINECYNWGFGNWDETNDYPWPKIVLYIWVSVFLSLCLLNIVIAFFSLTFEEVTAEKELIRYSQFLIMISKQYAFLRATEWCRPRRRRGELKYLHFFVIKNEEDSTTNQVNEKILEVETKVDQINKKVDQVYKKIDLLIESLGSRKAVPG